jgi:hypothetical protein
MKLRLHFVASVLLVIVLAVPVAAFSAFLPRCVADCPACDSEETPANPSLPAADSAATTPQADDCCTVLSAPRIASNWLVQNSAPSPSIVSVIASSTLNASFLPARIQQPANLPSHFHPAVLALLCTFRI